MKTFFSIFLSLFAIISHAQQPEEKIVEALDSFSFARPQEKAYLQTDKQQYLAGETIWFKAYVTLNGKPAALSQVVYVTLADNDGVIIEKKMLKLTKGTASGDIPLGQLYKAGHYQLSCYTLWMLNFPEFIQTKPIHIYNTDATTASSQRAAIAKNYSCSFFPESGNLVAGVSSKVAFKMMDEQSQAVTGTGIITDQDNKQVATFKSLHNGMGSFDLTPIAGKLYTAAVTINGKTIRTSLPAIKNEGIVISADNSVATKLFVKLFRGEQNKQAYNELILVGQQNNQVVYMARLNFDEGKDAVAINKKNLQAGIVQLTVLNIQGAPLAERLAFISNYAVPDLTAQTDFSKRSKNNFNINVAEFAGLNAAVSVVDAATETTVGAENILSTLLLSSDLKGRIEQPGQYFINKEDSTIQKLDLLMLINGWRRFKWDELLAHQYTALHYPLETGLSITGKVFTANGKTALPNGRISLILKGQDSTTSISEATLNDKSQFVVGDLNFKESATVYYQGANAKKERAIVSVDISTAYVDSVKNIPVGTGTTIATDPGTPETITAYLENKKRKADNDAKLLSNIEIRARKISPTDSVNNIYANNIFVNSDQTLIMDNGNYFDVWQYLQRNVPGIRIEKTGAGADVSFSRFGNLDVFASSGTAPTVQFFLNEIPVSNEIIDAINPNDIGIIKIYKGVTGIVLGADRGAIALYTVKGKSGRDWRDKGFDFVKRTGYSVTREFYAMDYAKLNPASEFTDKRSTIYWNPSITVENGKANISFYNDDETKKFRVIIEGIATDGKLLHIEKEL